MSANQFPVWTCSLLMKFSQLLVPSPFSSVREYNYVENAYSSFCLPAAYSVRCIRPWSGIDEESVSVSVSPPDCLYAWLLDYPGSGSRWHGEQVTITQLPKRNLRKLQCSLRFFLSSLVSWKRKRKKLYQVACNLTSKKMHPSFHAYFLLVFKWRWRLNILQ